MPIVTIFGSGKVTQNTKDYLIATEIGRALSQSGFHIATGGFGGIMEAALKGAYEGKGERIGVSSQDLSHRSLNKYVTKEIHTTSYLERMNELINIGDAYIFMPGGTGTVLELAAVWALSSKGLLENKLIITVGELWNEMIQTLEFYSEEILEKSNLITNVQTPNEAIDLVLEHLKK